MATDLEKLVVQLSADVKQYQRGLQNAMGVTNRQARAIENRWSQANKKLDNIGSNMARGLVTPLIGVAAALSVREVATYADAWTKAKNSLAVAGVTGTAQVAVLDKIYQSAQSNAAPLEAMAGLFGKAAQASDNLGASTEDLVKFTDGVGVALRVAGTSATEASGALTQLGQLLGSARVQAEEFNSVNEGARPILIAVANGLDAAGGSVSKLKTLVNDGKVSSQEFFRAFMKGLPTIQAMAGNATMTIEQGFTKVSNAFTKYIGQTDESLGASQRLVSGLNALADNFKETADHVVQLASVIAGALVGRAIAGMLVQMGVAITAVTRFVAALRAAASLAGVAAAISGVSAAAGPIGLVVGGLAVGALTLFYSSSERASEGAQLYADALKRVKKEAEEAAPAIESLPEIMKRKLKDAADTGAKEAAEAMAEINKIFETSLVRAVTPTGQKLIDDETVAELKRLRDGLNNGTVSSDSARNALQRLANSKPNFQSLADALDPVLKKLGEVLARTKVVKDEQAALRPPTFRESENASMSAYEKMAAAGKKFSDELDRRAGLTKDQLGLETKIAELRKKAKEDGATFSDGQFKKMAETELAGDKARSEEGKAPKRTTDDRFSYDVQSIHDRIAALDLERETMGMSVGEQQKRQMALQLEQQALADLREEARRNGETNLAAIQLSPDQVAAIDQTASAWGRASERMEQARLAQQRFSEAQQDLGNFAIDLATNWTGVNDALQDGLKLLQQWVLKAALLGEGPLGGLFGSSATSSSAGGLIGALFKGFGGSGTGFSLTTTGGLYDSGGYTGPGGKKQPAGVVHKGEVVWSQDDVRRAGGVAVVEAMRRRQRGYDTGGAVGASIPTPATVSGGPARNNYSFSTAIDATGSSMTAEQLHAVLDQRDRALVQRMPGIAVQSVLEGKRYKRGLR